MLVTVRVTKVVPDGWADVNGVMIDDEIMKIGRKRTNMATKVRFEEILNQTRPLKLHFDRPKETLDRINTVSIAVTGEDSNLEFEVGSRRRGGYEIHTLGVTAYKFGLFPGDILVAMDTEDISQEKYTKKDIIMRLHHRPINLEFQTQRNFLTFTFNRFAIIEGFQRKLGVQFGFVQNRLFITHVYPNTWAESVGIWQGDQVSLMNDRSVASLKAALHNIVDFTKPE